MATRSREAEPPDDLPRKRGRPRKVVSFAPALRQQEQGTSGPPPSPAPPPSPPLMASQQEAGAILDALKTSRRDQLGFTEADIPHLSATQFNWLCHRLLTGDDLQANALTGTSDAVIQEWSQDQGFLAMYQLGLSNKREAFRLLGGHLLPKVLLRLSWLLDQENARAAQTAINLLLRSQGLLIDTVRRHDPTAIETLLHALREQRPLEALPPGRTENAIVEGSYQEGPEGPEGPERPENRET